uniref:NAD(P)-binding protein n=1 Tax=Nocardia takedensis TaxID=259390 RepID=UPI001FE09CA0
MPTDFDILVIGAGQAGLSAGYHLRRLGLVPERDFLIVDHAPGPGGAWQFRWPSLTLSTVNRVHDLPGMSFAETLPPEADAVPAATAVPHYYALYEKRFDLRVRRQVSVTVVCDRTADGQRCDGRGEILRAEILDAGADRAGAGGAATGNLGTGSPGTGNVGTTSVDADSTSPRHAETGGASRHAAGTAVTEILRVRGLINATGTWERPFIPHY